MVWAFRMFHTCNKQKGYVNSRAYATNREEWSKLNKEFQQWNVKRPEVKDKIRNSLKNLWKNPKYRMTVFKPSLDNLKPFNFKSEVGKIIAAEGRNKSHEVCSKKIQCIETGEIFKSLHEASDKMNIACNNICHCLKGRRPHAGGYHWRYINAEA